MKNIEVLNSEELVEVNGGAISAMGWLAIGGGIIFLIGVADGIIRPYACN